MEMSDGSRKEEERLEAEIYGKDALCTARS